MRGQLNEAWLELFHGEPLQQQSGPLVNGPGGFSYADEKGVSMF